MESHLWNALPQFYYYYYLNFIYINLSIYILAKFIIRSHQTRVADKFITSEIGIWRSIVKMETLETVRQIVPTEETRSHNQKLRSQYALTHC